MEEKKMKKITAIVFVLFFVFAAASWAHPPENIIITFDGATSILKADIIHHSKDITQHFIDEAWVFVNGEMAVDQKFKTQTDAAHQVVKYILPGIKPGDKIEVGAECSVFGKDKKGITISNLQPKRKK